MNWGMIIRKMPAVWNEWNYMDTGDRGSYQCSDFLFDLSSCHWKNSGIKGLGYPIAK